MQGLCTSKLGAWGGARGLFRAVEREGRCNGQVTAGPGAEQGVMSKVPSGVVSTENGSRGRESAFVGSLASELEDGMEQ